MRNKLWLTLGALSAAGIIGLTVFQSDIVNAGPKLTREDVSALVTSQYPGKIVELELEKEGKLHYYEVEVMLDGREYELKVHADTGEVLRLEEKKMPAGSAVHPPASDNKEAAADKGATADKPVQDTNGAEAGQDNRDDRKTAPPVESNVGGKQDTVKRAVISKEEAKQIALANFAGTIKEVELDRDDGLLTYEIEIRNGQRKADIDIDAYTGKVIVLEIETDDDDDYDDRDDD